MSAKRYRIGDGRGWYSNYGTKIGTGRALAKRIRLILERYKFYEVQPKNTVTESERREMIHTAAEILVKLNRPR
jgi:hypothetical protein